MSSTSATNTTLIQQIPNLPNSHYLDKHHIDTTITSNASTILPKISINITLPKQLHVPRHNSATTSNNTTLTQLVSQQCHSLRHYHNNATGAFYTLNLMHYLNQHHIDKTSASATVTNSISHYLNSNTCTTTTSISCYCKLTHSDTTIKSQLSSSLSGSSTISTCTPGHKQVPLLLGQSQPLAQLTPH